MNERGGSRESVHRSRDAALSRGNREEGRSGRSFYVERQTESCVSLLEP